jgi:hypothetical protein
MLRTSLHWFFWMTACLAVASPVRAEVTAEQVRDAIRRGANYLKGQQSKNKGGWSEVPGQPGGLSALCTLALLESGEPLDSPPMTKALAYVRSLPEPKATYTTALQVMVLCAAEPKKDLLLIRRAAEWLAQTQITDGERAGAWTYFGQIGPHTRGDNSNSQFALLGLHEAEQAGVQVNEEVWKRSLKYWLGCQRDDGAWGYYKKLEGEPAANPTGSMTCAGIAALVIASGKLSEGDAIVQGGAVRCCGEQHDNDRLERALEWIGTRFSVHHNPGFQGGLGADLSQAGLLYYLYGIERVGRLTGRRFIGQHDWYREGAEMLVQQQDSLNGYWKGVGHREDDPVVGTALALLFLSKGRRPVVLAKLKHGHGNDWDRHRSAIHHLTRYLEQRWQQKLTWQTIDVRAATVQDLLETPVLFLSGQAALDLTVEQKQNLREYVGQGGFLFAESCCEGEGFDRSFRQLMQDLFPEQPLRLLPPEHAIWFAEAPVKAAYLRPLYGINACCRTSVVYCPQNLSCYWELSRGDRATGYPATVNSQIEACLTIGANVVAYATNRQLSEKLARPKLASSRPVDDPLARGAIIVPRLSAGGASEDAANALPNLVQVLRTQLGLAIQTEPRPLAVDDPLLLDRPVAFLHGRRDFQLTAKQRAALAIYLQRGGFLFGDAICASPQFAAAFRREITATLPDARFEPLPSDHPLLTREFRGYDLSTVTLRDPQVRTGDDPLKSRLVKIKPQLEVLELDGRMAVVFSPYDLSCALENQASLECKGYVREDAARIAANVILYALQQ